jgi:hypothetical protein
MMTICRNEEERLRLISEEKYILDHQSEIAYEVQEERKKWENVVAEWQNIAASKDAEIARLQGLLKNY